jgi:son of sevenless-like protein
MAICYEQAARLVATDGNRHAYRKTLAQAAQPCVPYLGVYLTDLTFIEDGNPDTVAAAGAPDEPAEAGAEGDEAVHLINWRKHELYAGVIDEVRLLA